MAAVLTGPLACASSRDVEQLQRGQQAMQEKLEAAATQAEAVGAAVAQMSADVKLLKRDMARIEVTVRDMSGDVAPSPSTSLLSGIPPEQVPLKIEKPERKTWFASVVGPHQSFVAGISYARQDVFSDVNYLKTCRTACWKNLSCLGFFEQTHLCPDRKANDKKSDPNVTPTKGCARVCGFFDQGKNPLGGTLEEGPYGSVWIKADALPDGIDPAGFFGSKYRTIEAP